MKIGKSFAGSALSFLLSQQSMLLSSTQVERSLGTEQVMQGTLKLLEEFQNLSSSDLEKRYLQME